MEPYRRESLSMTAVLEKPLTTPQTDSPSPKDLVLSALRAVLLAHLFNKLEVVMAQLAALKTKSPTGKGAQA